MLSHRVLRLVQFIFAFVILTCFLFPQPLVFAATVTLAWDSNEPAPEGYRVYKRIEGQSYDYSTAAWSGTQNRCTLKDLKDDVAYHFVVRAYVGSDISGDSNEITFQSDDYPAQSVINNSVQDDTISDSVSNTNQFTIGASAGDHGTIYPSGSLTLPQGNDQTFRIEAKTGYHIADLLVDGKSFGPTASYTFTNLSDNHTIAATFAINTYTLSASYTGAGSISPKGKTQANYGDSLSYTIVPNSGYHIDDVLVDGICVGTPSAYTFANINANHTIKAVFKADSVYTIVAESGANGSISPLGSTRISAGGTLSYLITAYEGYVIEDVRVDGVSVGAVDKYIFSRVNADHYIQVTFTIVNEAPVADAGPDQTVAEGRQVILNGLNSIDMDDGIADFIWRQIKGPEVVLNSAQEAQARFIAPNVDEGGQVLVFELIVTDYSGVSSVDSCIVNVAWVNTPPVAEAGEDQTVYAGDTVRLNATASSDPDNCITAYHWTQRQGPKVRLADDEASMTTFTAPETCIGGASLVFELTVTDAAGLQDSDTCVVRVAWNNEAPTADAGLDQDAITGDEVILDGSDSTDPDDGIRDYLWKQTDGPPVTLSDTTAVRPVFTAPPVSLDVEILKFDLVVTDHNGLQSADSCQVFVTPAVFEDEDRQPPQIAITNPNSSYWHTTDYSVTLIGTVTDDVGVDRVLWSNNRGYSGDADIYGNHWVINNLRLKTWFNVITVTAYDTNGNKHFASLLVFVSYR